MKTETAEQSAQICRGPGNSMGNRPCTGQEAQRQRQLQRWCSWAGVCSQKWGPLQRTGPPRPPGQMAPSVPGPLHSPPGTSFPEACEAGRK